MLRPGKTIRAALLQTAIRLQWKPTRTAPERKKTPSASSRDAEDK